MEQKEVARTFRYRFLVTEGNVAVAILFPIFGSPLIASGADFVPG